MAEMTSAHCFAHDVDSSMLSTPGEPDLFVSRQRPYRGREPLSSPAVLYVHGATFPSALSVSYPLDGRSWGADLAEAGLDVWAFDFAGFGRSERYPGQDRDPAGAPPLGRAHESARQLERVLKHVVAVRGGGRVSLLAHSWGTMVAGLVAGRFPELVDRLVLFAPFARRDLTGLPDAAALGGWFPLTVAEQHSRFVSDVPDGHPPVLTPQFDQWAAEWLATDPVSGGGSTPSVRTPSGPRADMLAAWSGDLPYEPGLIEAPTCIVRGEWDSMCTDEDARGLFAAITSSPLRQDVKISEGGHLMHLESGRRALYRAAAGFLLGA